MLSSGCCPQWRLGRKWKEANRRWGIKWRPFLGSWALRPRMSKMNKIESKYSICDIIHSELTLYDRGYIVWNFGIYRNHGQSQYGILSMQWITDIPISNAPVASTPRAYPRSESSTSQVTDRSMDANTVKSMGRNTSRLPRLAQKYSKTNVSRYA